MISFYFEGMDLNCGSFLVLHTKSAIEKGKIQEQDIDRALLNLFSVQLRLGIFDKPQNDQFGPNNVCTKEHRELAAEAVRQGTVLLKNDNSFLPLKRNEVRHVAIIGPSGNDVYAMGGDYTGFKPLAQLNVLLTYYLEYISNIRFTLFRCSLQSYNLPSGHSILCCTNNLCCWVQGCCL